MNFIQKTIADKDAEIKRLNTLLAILQENINSNGVIVKMRVSTLSKLSKDERNDLISQVGPIELVN
jgi:hypothetical protein